MKKFKKRILYGICTLLPLLLAEGFIIKLMFQNEQAEQLYGMEKIIGSVQADLVYTFEEASRITNVLYINRSINEFLDTEYASPLEYYSANQELLKRTLYELLMGSRSETVVLCSDNETIVNGGHFYRIDEIREETWYEKLQETGRDMVIHFYYVGEKNPAASIQRRVSIVRKLNYYKDLTKEKLVRIDLNYSTLVRRLREMNYAAEVYVCSGDKILYSNTGHSGVTTDYTYLTGQENIGCEKEFELYGEKFRILVMHPKDGFFGMVTEHIPFCVVVLILNIGFPALLVTMRSKEVYRRRVESQRTELARQNAELKALHSQIDPHFLFNVLESIRMHCIIKREEETAAMIERLAVLERKNVDWRSDYVKIKEELSFIEAYLELQKYRFGDRLSYKMEWEEECGDLYLPKLTLTTFVENSCIHGVEKKSAPCWIYVRVYREEDQLYLEIEDTGVGMEESVCSELCEKMRVGTIDTLRKEDHVGIINACLRLRMQTEETTEFSLESEPGAGTFILIKVPLRYLKDNGR